MKLPMADGRLANHLLAAVSREDAIIAVSGAVKLIV